MLNDFFLAPAKEKSFSGKIKTNLLRIIKITTFVRFVNIPTTEMVEAQLHKKNE